MIVISLSNVVGSSGPNEKRKKRSYLQAVTERSISHRHVYTKQRSISHVRVDVVRAFIMRPCHVTVLRFKDRSAAVHQKIDPNQSQNSHKTVAKQWKLIKNPTV